MFLLVSLAAPLMLVVRHLTKVSIEEQQLMEIAGIVLQYISVLIWPTVVLAFAFWFRDIIRKLLVRVLLESKQIDLQVAGQKVSVTLTKEVVKDAINTVVNNPELSESPRKIEQIATSSALLLEILPKLENTDIDLLKLLQEPSDSFQANVKKEKTAIRKLKSLGLVDRTMEPIRVTEFGRRVQQLLADKDIDEALHKIGQAL